MVTWYKDSVSVFNGPDFVIPMLKPLDRGSYMCTAVNKYGNVSSNEVRLSIKGLAIRIVITFMSHTFLFSRYISIFNTSGAKCISNKRYY